MRFENTCTHTHDYTHAHMHTTLAVAASSGLSSGFCSVALRASFTAAFQASLSADIDAFSHVAGVGVLKLGTGSLFGVFGFSPLFFFAGGVCYTHAHAL